MPVRLLHNPPASATVGTSSAEVLAAKKNRKLLVLTNLSVNEIYIGIDAPAVVGKGIPLLSRGSNYSTNLNDITIGAINAIANVAGSELAIQEAAS